MEREAGEQRRASRRAGRRASRRARRRRPRARAVGQLLEARRAGRRDARRARPSSARVTRRAASAGSMFIVTGSTSTSTGVAPASATTFAVAGNVYAGTSTSSPGADAEREHGDVQRRGPGRHRDRVLGAGGGARAAPRTPRPSAPSSAGRTRAPRGSRRAPPRRRPGSARRIMSAAGFRLRYHAIVLSRPSSSSTSRLEADVLARLARRSGCAARRRRSRAARTRSRPGSR